MIQDLRRVGDTTVLIRVAMETQRYDDPALAGALRDECADIRNVTVDAWDSDWFARLGLLVAALRDANGIGSADKQSVGSLPTAVELLSMLMTSDLAAQRLIQSLVGVDPESAINLASSSQDERLHYIVADAADDLGVLIGLIAKGAITEPSWRLALLRSAFLHGRVAQAVARSLGQ
jgi:hypothetical protein